MGFSRRRKLEWGVGISSPGDLPNPGIEPKSPESPALAGRFFTTELSEKIDYSNMKYFCDSSNKEEILPF